MRRLQLRRDSCPLDAKAGLWFSPAKAGDRVARGPKWPLGNMTDGGPGGVGRVVSVMKSEMTATVKWFLTGEEGKYKMGAVADAPINDNDSAPASVDDLLVSCCTGQLICRHHLMCNDIETI